MRLAAKTISLTLLAALVMLLIGDLLTAVPFSGPQNHCGYSASKTDADNQPVFPACLQSTLFAGREPVLSVMTDLATRDEAGITALSGVLLAVITGWLVFVARDQSKTTRAQLRAYVRPDVLGLKAFSLTSPIEITVEWKNTGATPAKDFEAHGLVWLAALPLPDNADFEPGDPKEDPKIGRHGKTAIFPQAITHADYVAEHDPQISPEVANAIIAGRVAIYVIAEAIYLDIFDRQHTSRMCRFIAPADAKILIEAERNNLSLNNLLVRFNASHIMNNFT